MIWGSKIEQCDRHHCASLTVQSYLSLNAVFMGYLRIPQHFKIYCIYPVKCVKKPQLFV